MVDEDEEKREEKFVMHLRESFGWVAGGGGGSCEILRWVVGLGLGCCVLIVGVRRSGEGRGRAVGDMKNL